MLFKDLVEMVNSCGYVKLYSVDHIHPGFLTGVVANPRMKERNGKNIPYIDLQPYVGLLSLDKNAPMMGYPVNDMVYNGFLFQGRYATTDFNYHKQQVMAFIDQIHKTGTETPEKLNTYLKFAKEL